MENDFVVLTRIDQTQTNNVVNNRKRSTVKIIQKVHQLKASKAPNAFLTNEYRNVSLTI
jgi:hypothetical protein